jgi:hypothetical protein
VPILNVHILQIQYVTQKSVELGCSVPFAGQAIH